jgi:glycosyltransferase involved in cell wall biosynthesis
MVALAVVVIAQNEEANITWCLQSIQGWTQNIFVIDGGSSDLTVAKAQALGAKVLEHPFTDWASQRNWALANIPPLVKWVLFLDADEQALEGLRREIDAVLTVPTAGVSAYAIRQEVVFLGKSLTHAHGGPHLIRLIHRDHAHWACEGAREYCIVNGQTRLLNAKLWHEDRRGLDYWIEKQNRNAKREFLHATAVWEKPFGAAVTRTGDRPVRTWLRTKLYPAIPYQLRPFVCFSHRYILNLGFLDGYAGFVFCFLHAFWYPLLIDAMVFEQRSTR